MAVRNKGVIATIRIISIRAMVIAGIGIILWPWLNALRFDMMQSLMMFMWRNSINIGRSDLPSGAWTHSTVVIGSGEPVNLIWEEDINPKINADHFANITEGILTIEKINYSGPILNKYNKSNLDVSVCKVSDSVDMGQVGNYVLTAHYSQIYGRHFNRIHEVEVGDIILMENKERKFKYIVTDIISVSESDVWVMANSDNKKITTLITCDYRMNPVGRLIVRGELLENRFVFSDSE